VSVYYDDSRDIYIIVPLRDAKSYPSRSSIDLLLPTRNFTGECYLWIYTEAEHPVIKIKNEIFLPHEVVVRDGRRWLFMGRKYLKLNLASPPVVSFLGLTDPTGDIFLITSNKDFIPHGGLADIERQILGYSRESLGVSQIIPNVTTVGRPVKFKLIFTAGETGIKRGGRIRLTIPRIFSNPQIKDPNGDGYLKIVKADAQLEIISIEVSRDSWEWIDITAEFKEDLKPGGKVIIYYKAERTQIVPFEYERTDRSYWFSKIPPMAISVMPSKRGYFTPLANGYSHTLTFKADIPERLHLIVPSHARTGERIVLHGIFTDKFRNLSDVYPLHADVRLKLLGRDWEEDLGRPRGFYGRSAFKMLLDPLPEGVYRIKADSPSGRFNSLSNPIKVDNDSSLSLYWGDIHAHSEMSDGIGSPESFYWHARNIACLDFTALTDHACYLTDNEWLWMQDLANMYNKPGKFVTFIGYEWSGKEGDRNFYTWRNELPLFRGTDPKTNSLRKVWRLIEGMEEEVIAIPHHSLENAKWEYHNPSFERLIEIYSMWGSSETADTKLWRMPKYGISVRQILSTGSKLGFTAGSDNHDGRAGFSGEGAYYTSIYVPLGFRSGLTAVYSNALSRREIFHSLRRRRCYATTGERIIISFQINDLCMGSEGVWDGSARIRGEVHGTDLISRLELIRNGEVVWSMRPNRMDVAFYWEDYQPPDELVYYYLRVKQADGNLAWTSPIWLTK